MGSPTESFKHESMENPKSIMKFLNSLSEGFEKGTLLFATDGNSLLVHPDSLIQFEIKAKKKDGNFKLNLKICWSENTIKIKSPGNDLNIQAIEK
ncbi:MAG: amphi-Trp domain-containing protein [Deltaproteobacteria bacterium]|nr:amphi-Trp domain-containing protein [Deltaproteobacteria bacterium]